MYTSRKDLNATHIFPFKILEIVLRFPSGEEQYANTHTHIHGLQCLASRDKRERLSFLCAHFLPLTVRVSLLLMNCLLMCFFLLFRVSTPFVGLLRDNAVCICCCWRCFALYLLALIVVARSDAGTSTKPHSVCGDKWICNVNYVYALENSRIVVPYTCMQMDWIGGTGSSSR